MWLILLVHLSFRVCVIMFLTFVSGSKLEEAMQEVPGRDIRGVKLAFGNHKCPQMSAPRVRYIAGQGGRLACACVKVQGP